MISLLILLFSGNLLFAGEKDTIKIKSQHLFSINSGYLNQTIRDEAISPFIYNGATAPINLNYQRLAYTSLQLVAVQFNQSDLKPGIPDYSNFEIIHHVKSVSIDLKYAYLHKLTSFCNLNLTLFGGGEFNSFLNIRDHFFTATNDYLMVDCFNSLSLSAFLEKKFNDKNQLLFFNVAVPFVSYVLMRQTYNAYVGEKIESLDLGKNVLYQLFKNGDFVSVPKLFDFRVDLTYVRYLGKHFGYNFIYSFHYYKFTQYDNLFYSRNLYNQFLVGILFKL
jgi:hypothetical protein